MARVASTTTVSSGTWPSDLLVHVCPTCGHESVLPPSQDPLPEMLFCEYCRTSNPTPFTYKLQNQQQAQQMNNGTDELSRLFLEQMQLSQQQQLQTQGSNEEQNQHRAQSDQQTSASRRDQPFSTLEPDARAVDASARYEPAYGHPGISEPTLTPRSQSVPPISAPYDTVMAVYASMHYTHTAHLKRSGPPATLVYDSEKGFSHNASATADFHNPEPYISSGYAYGHWLERRERDEAHGHGAGDHGDTMMSD